MDLADADPKGLVRESYRIDGITAEECRSIFMDWALSVPVGRSIPDAVRALVAEYGVASPGHPMTVVLGQALSAPAVAARRGGRAGRQGRAL
jgi:hypothetical protein